MAINSNLTLLEKLNDIQNNIDSMEQILGKGLDQPYNCSNSGARKILYSTQKDHIVPVEGAEPAYNQTGYENRYGDLSSSIIKTYQPLQVIAIIPKFSFAPKHDYFIIFKGADGKYNAFERIHYVHTTECYGYLYNNEYLDSLRIGDIVPPDKIIRKSKSYDAYNNRQDGANLVCGYISTEKNKEDSVLLCDEAAEKLATTHLRRVAVIFNNNDIPLNLYDTSAVLNALPEDMEEPDAIINITGNINGDIYSVNDTYKSFPDIGEDIKDGILVSVRRENREQFLFTQSYDRLSKIMMSDDKFTTKGKVIDINIYSNDKEILKSFYNIQLKKYDDEAFRFASEVVNITNQIKETDPNADFEYDLQKLTFNSKRIVRQDQFIKDKNGKVFGNTIMEFVIADREPVTVGDKVSDRYGGKGVVSYILPKERMPKDDLGRTLDAIINQSTCVNRENPGQLMETSVNHVNARLVQSINRMDLSTSEAVDLIIEFLLLVAPEEGVSLRKYLDSLDSEACELFLESIYSTGLIYTSMRPITDNLTLDKINELYKHFPWIGQSELTVPLEDSNGNIRYIPSRRKIVAGDKYMFRLKQFADDKFSSTSMSATNIKNLNTRSKNSKNYKSLHSTTPIAQGTMETDDQAHVGIEFVVSNLMIHSVSPHGRRKCQEMLTGNPFAINIMMDDECKNRNAEILNTYLKAKGLRLKFTKKLKAKKISFVKWDQIPQNTATQFIQWTDKLKAKQAYANFSKKNKDNQFLIWEED